MKNRVVAGECSAAMAWNDTSAQGAEDDPRTEFFVPGEGARMLADGFSILAQALGGVT